MTHTEASYEEARDLGEVVSNGLRYHVFYDPKRQRTVCVLVPGQSQIVGSSMPTDHGHA
jgi:hypothetical protein